MCTIAQRLKKKKKNFVFILWLEYFIYFFFLLLPHFYLLLLSPLSQSSTLFISSQLQFLHSPPTTPTQASAQRRQHRPKPSANNADPSPCPAPTMPIDLFILRPYLYAISFFLYSVFQSFSVSNTKTHDHRCWVLILSPWLTKQRCCRDCILCW